MTLPCSPNVRWTAKRKAAIVMALRDGVLSFADICDRYYLSKEELAAWEVAYARGGIAGLHSKAHARQRQARRDRI
jgi:hypothetical protein